MGSPLRGTIRFYNRVPLWGVGTRSAEDSAQHFPRSSFRGKAGDRQTKGFRVGVYGLGFRALAPIGLLMLLVTVFSVGVFA